MRGIEQNRLETGWMQIFDSYGDGGTSYIVTADGVQVGSVAANAYGSSATVDFSI